LSWDESQVFNFLITDRQSKSLMIVYNAGFLQKVTNQFKDAIAKSIRLSYAAIMMLQSECPISLFQDS
jgi:hypothetical protein